MTKLRRSIIVEARSLAWAWLLFSLLILWTWPTIGFSQEQAKENNRIESLLLQWNSSSAVLHIQANYKPVLSSYLLSNPERLVLDFPNSELKPGVQSPPGGNALISHIELDEQAASENTVRVVLYLQAPVDYSISHEKNTLTLILQPMPGSVPVAMVTPSPSKAQMDAEKKRLEEERRKQQKAERLRQEEERRKQQEAERLRLEEERRKQQEAERLRLEEERRKQQEAERLRLEEERRKQQEAERLRLEEERRKQQEAERLRLEEERRKQQEAERLRLEQERLKQQEAERLRLEEERREQAAERARLEEEQRRKQEAERLRLQQQQQREQAERERLEQQRLRQQQEERRQQEEEARQKALERERLERLRAKTDTREVVPSLPTKKLTPISSGPATVRRIGFHPEVEYIRVNIMFDKPTDFGYEWQSPTLLLVHFSPARVTNKVNLLPLYTRAFGTAVSAIRPDWDSRKQIVTLRIELNRECSVRIQREQNDVDILLGAD